MSSMRDTRGPIILEAKRLPTRTRAIRNRDGSSSEWEEPLIPVKTASRNNEAAQADSLLSDVRLGGYGDKSNGFARYANERTAGTGAGPDVTYEHEPSNNYEIGSGPGGGENISQTYDIDGDMGESDLFGQPSRQPRIEYGDTFEDSSRRGEPDYMAERDFMDDNNESPTVDPGQELDQRSLPRRPRKDSTFAKRGL